MTDSLLPDSGTDEGDVCQGREHQGHRHHRGGGDIESRDDAGDVHGQHSQEEGPQQGGEAASVLIAQKHEGHVAAHEVGDELEHGLAAPGDGLEPAGGHPHRQAQGDPHDDADESEPVELQERTLAKERFGEEVLDAG